MEQEVSQHDDVFLEYLDLCAQMDERLESFQVACAEPDSESVTRQDQLAFLKLDVENLRTQVLERLDCLAVEMNDKEVITVS